ncbi:MAG TPA: hypothetical protein VGN68_19950 [Sphingopyxis sp.]|uniref:hypothetical protein n=1 Tax=Sphingopyxis sp. TaxID=1908224 RepID=UPI002E0D8048|nr:hypothetical protein [Sphingopyxis sp.]
MREALATGTACADLIFNILSRRREPPRPLTIIISEESASRHPPIADCARYDHLRTFDAAAKHDGSDARAQGMAGAFDDAITTGLQRQRTTMEKLTDPLRA